MEKPSTIIELTTSLRQGCIVTHRGFPVNLSEPIFEGDDAVPTRWEGESGFHIQEKDLPDVLIEEAETEFCPYCGSVADIRDCEEWKTQSLADCGNTAILLERQCHTERCGGRSFWVDIDK